MKFVRGFDEAMFKKIAAKANNSQIKRDISFMRVPVHNGADIYAERIDEAACVCGYFLKCNDLRIIGLATDVAYQGRGLATILVCRAFAAVKERGGKRIYTKTKDGRDFYAGLGFSIADKIGDEYIMEGYV